MMLRWYGYTNEKKKYVNVGRMNMSGFISRIGKRIKKYIVWLVLLPVVLGAFGFFFAKGTAQQSSYTAAVTLILGKYDDGVYNNIAEVTSLLKKRCIFE
ncbi:hypothetical protein BsIDN1_62540 [Bacillus safensis]|uniref:Polysaccharide chain length determinant N-terminal domain-containing protein n=1 Tax=Bacillus safensis TaxID=561879 RepID=A0A5S9MLV8_BACIA|nr:hypothetical protein BsIDN1_62540 [Bacillus safensis]